MVEEVKKHCFIVNPEKRAFCAIFRRFEVPRDGFYINRIRKIAFISKRLAEKFCYMVKVLQFLSNLKGKVVWSLPSYICPAGGYSTPKRSIEAKKNYQPRSG